MDAGSEMGFVYFEEHKDEPEMFRPYVNQNYYNYENDPTAQQVWDDMQGAIETNFAIHANPWIRKHQENAKHLRACVDLLEEVGNDAHKHVVSMLKGHPGYETIGLQGIPQALLSEFVSDGCFLYELTERYDLEWAYAYNYDDVCQIDIIGSNYNGVIAAKKEIQERIYTLATGGDMWTDMWTDSYENTKTSKRWERHVEKYKQLAPLQRNLSIKEQDHVYDNFWDIENERERDILQWIHMNDEAKMPNYEFVDDLWPPPYNVDEEYDWQDYIDVMDDRLGWGDVYENEWDEISSVVIRRKKTD